MKNLLKNILYITFGCVLYSIGIAVFLQPNTIAPGGFSGIAIIIDYLTGVPAGTVMFALNIPVFFVAYKKLGKYFVITTIYAVIFSSFLINVLPQFIKIDSEPLLAAIYGGIFLGLGLGFVFTVESSTGGTDVISRIVRLYKPHLSLGQIMIFVDMTVVISGIIAFKNINSGLYAIITLYIATKVIDSVIEGQDLAKLVYIISDKNDEIATEIGTKLIRGSTMLSARGSYTKIEKNVLMCAVRRHQIPKVKEIALKYDEQSFMIVTDVREVLGHGFKLKGNKNGI